MLVACAALLAASASSPLSVHAQEQQEQQALPEIAVRIQYNSITPGSVVAASESTNPPGLGFDIWGATVTVNSPTAVSVKFLDEIDAGRGDTNANFFVKTPSGSCQVEIAWGDDSKVYASSRYHVGSITCSVSPLSTAVDSRGQASVTVDVHSSPAVAVWSLTKAVQQNRKLPKSLFHHRVVHTINTPTVDSADDNTDDSKAECLATWNKLKRYKPKTISWLIADWCTEIVGAVPVPTGRPPFAKFPAAACRAAEQAQTGWSADNEGLLSKYCADFIEPSNAEIHTSGPGL